MNARYAVNHPTSLRTCVVCGRSPRDGIKLMRCNGCIFNPPTYCSKECQKSHWTTHKAYCNHKGKEKDKQWTASPKPVPGSIKDLARAFDDYLAAHEWAIEAVTKMANYVEYEFGRLEQPDNVAIRFNFKQTPPARNPSGNPAGAFNLVNVEMIMAKAPELVKQWADYRARALAHFRRDCPPNARSPDNAILAEFSLARPPDCPYQTSSSQTFPWYRPNPEELPCEVADPDDPFPPVEELHKRLADSLQELKHICLASLNTDLPFRSVKTSHWLRVAVPGRYKRIHKEWVWEPLFMDWDDYHEGRTDCPPLAALKGMPKHVTPAGLMFLYHNI